MAVFLAELAVVACSVHQDGPRRVVP